MDLDVNRRPVKVECDPATPLLWVLRDHLSLTGTKFGCGVAACGADAQGGQFLGTHDEVQERKSREYCVS
ncbi:2Fe-2S iron-sulfur cluster-binding protein, partial [Ralstonia pseudosolanacearum]|uniref:2Fe-2S iron-sulfur cluster-binding protein n=1 Tax=Ralstonia pseudosolanacearum TaxID=1310165 RepID=UPI003CF51358